MIRSVFMLLILIMGVSSCTKEEGIGGRCTVVGKILIQDYNSDGELKNTYYAPEERVYIVYGDSPIYNDDTKTNYDGMFVFEYLHEGSYTIYAYSDCAACDSGQSPIFKEFYLTDKETKVLEDLIILK